MCFILCFACQSGLNQSREEWLGPVGAALELRMKLNPHKEGMVGDLDNLHKIFVFVDPRAGQARRGELLAVVVVKLVAMPVALLNKACSVEFCREAPLRQMAVPES